MLDDFLQDQAAVYASGAMSAHEREQFEWILEFHGEARALTSRLQEAAAAAALADLRPVPAVPRGLKGRILEAVRERSQAREEGFVVTGPDGLVRWVNPAFTEMCGYTLEELRGRKLGPLLQGEKTDRSTAARMREAVHARRACQEEILNYHRDGAPYWVSIHITPIFDAAGDLRWMVARERELKDRELPGVAA